MAHDTPHIKVKFDLPGHVINEIRWTWSVLANFAEFQWSSVDSGQDIAIGTSPGADIPISDRFIDILQNNTFDHEDVFVDEPLIKSSTGKPDYLGTSFYMLNCLQEYSSKHADQYGRFPYSASYQKKFGCVHRNLVGEYFQLLVDGSALSRLIELPERPTRVFLTHDIDRISHAYAAEGKWALMHGRIDKMAIQAGKWIASRSDWLNIEDILRLHDEYGVKSCFMWLPKRGTDEQGIRNADYDLKAPSIRDSIRLVEEKGSANGMHKSSFPSTYKEEAAHIPMRTSINRNHYLKFTLPRHFEELDEASIEVDSSLGFSESIGFRNSYGLPYHPFNMKARKPFEVLEVPLNIMDVSLFNNPGIQPDEYAGVVIDFLEKHRHNCVMTILWHNNYITTQRFKRELAAYKEILGYLQSTSTETILPDQIVRDFGQDPNPAH